MRTSAERHTGGALASELETVLHRLATALQLPADAEVQARVLALQLLEGLEAPKLSGDPDVDGSASGFELSVAFAGERPEIHLRWEIAGVDQAERCEPRLRELLASSFDRVRPLFPLFSAEAGAPGWLSLSAKIWPTRAPELTAQLNPQVLGQLHAPALIEHTLELLGLGAAWHGVSRASLRGPELDELSSLSVVLSETMEPEAEVRIRHREPSVEIVASALRVAPSANTEQLLQYLRECVDQPESVPMEVESSLRFSTNSGSDAVAAALCLPVRRSEHFASRALAAMGAARPALAVAAAKAVGSVSAISVQSPSGLLRLQLSGAVDDVGSARVRKVPEQAVPPVERMVTEYEAEPLSLHPFFQRMGRHSVNVTHMWLMFSNIYAGLSQHFPRRLARVIFTVEDERIRSVLTEQLNEELGAGDYRRTHRRLFLKLLEALAPWQPAKLEEQMKQPGLRLSENLEAAYFDPAPYAGVGAAIVIELLGKQVDQFVAVQ